MKNISKLILKYYLKYAAKLAILIHRPTIIAVAGSVGKGFLKEEIKKMLEKKNFSARVSPNNFNTEIGLPLAVLDLPSGYNEWKGWLPAILGAPKSIWRKNFPQFLVLEMGVSHRGDMKYLLSIVKPEIGIITDINQRYIEKFSGVEDLIGEYARLVQKIPRSGLAVLNYDNMRVRALGKKAAAKKVFFGAQEGADFRALSIERTDTGEKVTVLRKEEEKEYPLEKFGRHHAMHLLATLAVEEYLNSWRA